MENKKNCKHEKGFKEYVFTSGTNNQRKYKKCVECKKTFFLGDVDIK